MNNRPSLAQPAFPDDDGTADPRLSAALEAYGEDQSVAAVVAAASGARLIVPIVALVGDAPAAGDKEADMAAVLMTGADGRTALLAFSSLATMQRWDANARPVPVPAQQAARAAVDEGATAILLDLAGPVFVVIETEHVHLLATHRSRES